MRDSGSGRSNGFAGRLWARFQPSAAPAIAERTRRRVTLYLVPFLFCLYILAYLDRVNVSVAALNLREPPLAATVASAVGLAASPGQGPVAAASAFLAGKNQPYQFDFGGLSFSDDIIGFGGGLFFWGYWILEIPSTVSVTRWGARWVFVRILVLWGICAALVGFIATPYATSLLSWMPFLRDSPIHQFYVLRFLLGFFEGGFFPSVIVYLSIWFRPEDRAKAIASFMAAIPLSNILGTPLSGMLLNVDWFGLAGWRWVFILEGLAPVVAGVATLFMLPDRPDKASWLPQDERDWLLGELERERKTKEVQGHGAWVHHMGMVLLLTFVYFCLNVSSYGLAFFMPKIMQELAGATPLGSTILAALFYVTSMIGMLVNGWHSDRTGERIWHVATPLALMALGMCLAGITGGLGIVPVVLMIVGVGSFLYAHLGAFWPIPTMFLGATTAAAAIGFINMVGNLGGFVGGAMVGELRKAGVSFSGCVLALAPFPLTGAIIIVVLGYVRRRRADEPDKSACNTKAEDYDQEVLNKPKEP
jgi:MFS family permease